MIDTKEFNLNHLGGNDAVRYFLYVSDDYAPTRIDYPKEVTEESLNKLTDEARLAAGFMRNTNSACFAGLPAQMGTKHGGYGIEAKHIMPTSNRILYYPNYTKHITAEHITKWVELSKKHGLLPKYCNAKDIIANKAFVFDLKAHTINMLFVYLCMARFLAADPTFVLNVIKLSSKFKINFLVALIIFSSTCIRNSNHHFLSVPSLYPSPNTITQNFKADLGVAVGLYRFIKNNGLPDGGEAALINKDYYCAHQTVSKLYSKRHQLTFEQLSSSYVPKMLKLNNDGVESLAKKVMKL